MGCAFLYPLLGKMYSCVASLPYRLFETLFSLVFIPSPPYPSRFARHVPHAGKIFVWGIVCMSPPSFGRRCPEGAEVGSRSGVKGDVWEAVFSFH